MSNTFPDGDVYVSYLKFGTVNSDSVRRLQVRLNEVEPKGTTLSITGNYDLATDKEVRLWQKHIGDKPDPVGKSFLGPKQAELIFRNSGNKVIDDTKTPTAPSSSLGKYLKARGHKVVDHNVPYGRDTRWIGPKYILVHHTGSPDNGSEQSIANIVKYGYSGTFPPLSQIMLGQSGTVWITCKQRPGTPEPGRASHAGFGDWPGVPKDRMNEMSIGIECQASGNKPLSAYPTMYKALIKLLADLCTRYDIPVKNVIGHKEWSSSGKVDPKDSMAKIRSDVAAELKGDTPHVPEKPTDPSDPIVGDKYIIRYTKSPSYPQPVTNVFKPVTGCSWAAPKDGWVTTELNASVVCKFAPGNDSGLLHLRMALLNPAGYVSPKDITISTDGFVPNADGTITFSIKEQWFDVVEKGTRITWEVSSSQTFESIMLTNRTSKWVLVPE